MLSQWLGNGNSSLSKQDYSCNQINKALRSILHPKPKPPWPNSLTQALISLPYIQGITNRISKYLIKKYIKIVFKPHKTLKQLFCSVKDKSNPLLS